MEEWSKFLGFGSMIVNAFENDVPEPKNNLWGHPFEVSLADTPNADTTSLPDPFNRQLPTVVPGVPD